MPDRDLVCADCDATFVFTEGEQRFLLEKGLTNAPRRCPPCREKAAADDAAGEDEADRPDELHDCTCAGCGTVTQVPFPPEEGKPVWCPACLAKGG